MTPSVEWAAINTVRCLAADMVQKANSGHPGAPMGCAPMAHTLFSKFVNCNPENPLWANRDRFVLSNGHACALLYSYLHLLGYKVSLDDLRAFRQLHSITPGHPEVHITPGVEVTTGPLGQGISNAVGLAIAQEIMAATYNRPGFELFNNYTYVIAGDGCLQEGVASEACSLAGHLQLGKLIVLYDDNRIQIDGSTDLAFTEDVLKRFESYGWHTLNVADGDNDLAGMAAAIEAARAETKRPTIIKIRTTIGKGSKLEGTEKTHGAPLGKDELANVKTKFGLDPNQFFAVSKEVYDFYGKVGARGQELEKKWNELFAAYKNKYPELGQELERRLSGKLPQNFESNLPRYTPQDAPVATRKLSEMLLNKVAPHLPEFVGGSADLTHSNLTKWKESVDFQAPSTGLGNYAGRYFRFGVREHGMAAICNGIVAYGGFISFASTFLNFISYALGAARLSALSHHKVVYIMTHDSIGLGEDGPTHQPIETLASCRALPNMLVMRPADGNEVSGAYLVAIRDHQGPTTIALTRQNLPHLQGSSVEAVSKGAYVLQSAEKPQVVLAATGSEVSIALDAAKQLEAAGVAARVVSMPCLELFDQQPVEYKKSVFPEGVPVLSVEAASTFGWAKYAHASVGIDRFGYSGPYQEVYKQCGIVPENIADKAKKVVQFYQGKSVPHLVVKPF